MSEKHEGYNDYALKLFLSVFLKGMAICLFSFVVVSVIRMDKVLSFSLEIFLDIGLWRGILLLMALALYYAGEVGKVEIIDSIIGEHLSD